MDDEEMDMGLEYSLGNLYIQKPDGTFDVVTLWCRADETIYQSDQDGNETDLPWTVEQADAAMKAGLEAYKASQKKS